MTAGRSETAMRDRSPGAARASETGYEQGKRSLVPAPGRNLSLTFAVNAGCQGANRGRYGCMSPAPGTIEQLARDVARTPDADTALRALSTLRRELMMAEPELVGRALQDGASWSQIARALGISKQATHRKYRHLKIDFEELTGAGELPLSGNARRSLGYARQEATSLGNPVIGTEHLLLGILRCRESRVVGLLEELGVDYDGARARTQPTMPGGSPPGPRDASAGRAHQGVSPQARRILEGAVREARRRHERAVGVEHLLAALLADSRNGAVQTLEAMRILPARVRRELEHRWS